MLLRLCRHAGKVLLAPSIADQVLDRLIPARGRLTKPAASTRRFALYLLDVGFMLYWKEFHEKNTGNMYYYWMADSSPQKGYDWLNSGCYCVRASSAKACLDAVRSLGSGRELPEHEIGELSRLLLDEVFFHYLPPVVLGKGAAAVEQKLAGWTYALWLETNARPLHKAVMDGTRSWTTDMGTELAFNDFRIANCESLLPGMFTAEYEMHPEGACGPDLASTSDSDLLGPDVNLLAGPGAAAAQALAAAQVSQGNLEHDAEEVQSARLSCEPVSYVYMSANCH